MQTIQCSSCTTRSVPDHRGMVHIRDSVLVSMADRNDTQKKPWWAEVCIGESINKYAVTHLISTMHNCIAAQRPTRHEDGPFPESFTVVLESCSFLHGTDRVSKTFVDQPFNLLSFSDPGTLPMRTYVHSQGQKKLSKELKWWISGKPLRVPSGPTQVHHTYPTSYDGRLWSLSPQRHMD